MTDSAPPPKRLSARERGRAEREKVLGVLLREEEPQERELAPASAYPEEYLRIFERFRPQPEDLPPSPPTTLPRTEPATVPAPAQRLQPASKKAAKRVRLQQIARLKVAVERPELVEAYDVSAPDPELLLALKAHRSTVEVPRHWHQKKKFLQGKRGFYKRVFKLPEFIERTGISKLRDPMAERDSLRMVRQKMRERMNPRLGRIDIDYQVLHDAFFKHQTRPALTEFGDVYFEGKEEAMKLRNFRPGRLSAELRKALGLGEGAPPPWLPAMQRFGPPPAYPSYRLPGIAEPAGEAVGAARDFEFPPHYLWGATRAEEEPELRLDLGAAELLALEGFGGA